MKRRTILAGATASAIALSTAPSRAQSPAGRIEHPNAYEGGSSPLTSGFFRPVQTQLDVRDLPVTGEIPRELNGTYLRNGMNPLFRPITYALPYDGDGMLHALTFENGKARYRNRYVMTRELVAEKRKGRALYGGYGSGIAPAAQDLQPGDPTGAVKNVSHTHIVAHAGRLLSLHENGPPYEITPALETVGEYRFGGRLGPAMTAHPKFDPATGEMVFFHYWGERSYLHYYVADRSGRITTSVPIDIPHSVVLHDFIITPRHAAWFCGPALLDPRTRERVWTPDLGTRIIVLPRSGDVSRMRTITADPFFVFHFMNAFEDGDDLVVDYTHHDGVGRGSPARNSYLKRSRINLATGSFRHEKVDDWQSELPCIDDRRAGLPYRFGYQPVALTPGGRSAVCQWDMAAGRKQWHDFGRGRSPGELVFLPRQGGTHEDEGWLVTYVYDAATDRSDAVLLDAADFGRGPVARIHLPQRVPFGLHGSWLPEMI